MRPILKLFFALVAAGCLIAGILIFRTLTFLSRQIAVSPVSQIALESDSLAKRLSAAIRYKTISHQYPENASVAEFLKFHSFLEKAFPGLHRTLTRPLAADLSLLYEWKGKNQSLDPVLLMAHMDVVPVDPKTESLWTHPPFSGRIADGYIWGRGAMDDKVGVMGILEAVEYLLAQGFEPQRTLYLAFGHDEEKGGQEGAAKIAAFLQRRQVRFEFILDEGGNITEGIVPGVTSPLALIGIAEKGYISLELTVESSGGHTSMPPPQTAIGILSGAIERLERNPFPARLSPPARRLLEFIGPEMSWFNKLVLANLWLFENLVKDRMAQSPLTDASIRTTQAATIFQAGIQENLLPSRASAIVNFRVLSGDSVSGVVERVRVIINDTRVNIRPLPGHAEPSSVSDIDSEAFKVIAHTIGQLHPRSLIAPFLMVAATDSRHFAPLAKNIFRFLPITLRAGDAERYHGIDERLSVKDYENAVRFYVQLIRNSSG